MMRIGFFLIVILGLFIHPQASAKSQKASAAYLSVSARHRKPIGSLHRMDFRLQGKSCPSCLLAIERKLKSLPGVEAAVVMLKRPFGVSVIYQTGQVGLNDILAIIKEKEPAVKVLEISDKNVNAMPSPLIPPFVP